MSEPKDTEPAPERAPYDAVVYFHGMGSQRRYEETSRLVDSLDRLLVHDHRDGRSRGMLSNIKVRVEPLRALQASNAIVGYIRAFFSEGPRAQGGCTVRFYEAYWAPIMAGQKSPWAVLKWMFRQPLRPWRTLRTPWRERQRLRRAALVALFDRGVERPAGARGHDYSKLVELYNSFEGLDAQRRYPAGTFDDFLAFIAEQSRGKPETAARRQALARTWRSAYRREELRNAFVLTTAALAIVLSAGGVLLSLFALLRALFASPSLTLLLAKVGVPATPEVWPAAVALGAALFSFLGLGKFLTDYMGDVEAWATYEETDEKFTARNKVLEQSMELLTHVLADPACQRVTVVSHSLGTSVAHDSLLALTRRNRAHNAQDPTFGPVPLGKIEHFVTMGSPIDKIEYFFESYASESHRYKRVVEALRGDIGAAPFTRNRKPNIHWVNFWDEGDVISGALHSPASAARFCQHVDNVHVASFPFPAPGSSHSGYFRHRLVIDALFRIIFRREHSFRALTPPAPGQERDYESAYLDPGEPSGPRRLWFMAALLIPWLSLAGVIAWVFDARTAASWLWAPAAAIAVATFLGYLAGKRHRQPV
jgi:hypothetical protein